VAGRLEVARLRSDNLEEDLARRGLSRRLDTENISISSLEMTRVGPS